jgi:predicted MFS family arabinose efflux permease
VSGSSAGRALPERALLFVVGAVQFVNVLDFMMVMPLGPDFAAGLGIPVSRLGLVGGSYTAAAAVAGMAGALFLDRFDRRKALGVALLGLVAGTAAGGFARGLPTMMAARLLAGAFGGPATSLAIAIVADEVPPERRGRALGAVMGAFSVAAVLGVPLGLELARRGGWRLPFFTVAALGAAVAVAAMALMPPMRRHLMGPRPAAPVTTRALLERRPVRLALLAMGSAFLSTFSLVPNLSAYFQFNGGFPRARLGWLYLAGGSVTFFSMRLTGRLVDRHGAPRVAAGATALYLAVLAGLGFGVPGIPVAALFVGFMLSSSTRNVAASALTSRVPSPAERARYMSAQSATQHLASSVGAGLSSLLLVENPDRSLRGMGTVAALAMLLAVAMPVLLARVASALGAHGERVRLAPVAGGAVAAAPTSREPP